MFNTEHRKEYFRLWCSNNRDKIKKYRQRYITKLRIEHPERIKELNERNKEHAYKSKEKYKIRYRDIARNNHLVLKNGKKLYHAPKRKWTGYCEICNRHVNEITYPRKINYHHWDDDKPEWGIWVCGVCHTVVEGIERKIHLKYLDFKDKIENGGN